VTFEHLVDVGLGGRGNVGRAVEGSGILSFGVASGAAAGVDIDELFVISGMITHVTDHLGTDGSVGGLIAVDLIGEGVEQAVAYGGRKLLACERQGRLDRHGRAGDDGGTAEVMYEEGRRSIPSPRMSEA